MFADHDIFLALCYYSLKQFVVFTKVVLGSQYKLYFINTMKAMKAYEDCVPVICVL